MDSLRLPDRLTIAVGASYINVRERADAPAYNGYEHFGVAFRLRRRAAPGSGTTRASATTPSVTLEPFQESDDGFLSFRLRYLLPLTVEAQYFPTAVPSTDDDLPRATARRFALPWDDPDQTDPVAALAPRARAELGDTFEVVSGRDRYLFVFSPAGLRAFYALPERDASKGHRRLPHARAQAARGAVRRACARSRTISSARRTWRPTSATSTTRSTSSSPTLGDRGHDRRVRLRPPGRAPARSRVLDRRRAPPSRRGSIGSSPISISSTAPTRSCIPTACPPSRRATSRPNAPRSRASRSRSASCWPIPTAIAAASSTRSRAAGRTPTSPTARRASPATSCSCTSPR